MPSVVFEPTIPASERTKTVHTLDRSATVTGTTFSYILYILVSRGITWMMEITRRQIPGSKIPKDVAYSFSYRICSLFDPFCVSGLFAPRRSKQETLCQGNKSRVFKHALIINSSKMCSNTQRENLDCFPICRYASHSTIEIDNSHCVIRRVINGAACTRSVTPLLERLTNSEE
jgi:hypothetical protein